MYGPLQSILEQMMTKQHAKWMMIINAFFLVMNLFFVAIGSAPVINLAAGMVCLGGLFASYRLYIETE